MQIQIPVQNNVEIIIGDVFVKCEVRIYPMHPPRTTEGKIALEHLEVRLNDWANRLAAQITKEIVP